MGDKEKNQYSLWNSEETKVLIELLVEGIQRGWRDSNGIMNKATVEHKILPVLNERLGCQKTHKHYQSRIKFLKGQYQCYVDLSNNSSGFGWDPIMKRFVASNEVWNDYLKGHPNHKFLRYDSNEQFDDLKIIFDCATANGSSSIGLGENLKIIFLSNALTRHGSRLIVPEGKFYLVDCEFANRQKFLAPFRRTRYHLQEFKGEGRDPKNQNELFNLRHASLRNVIERIFSIFKSRFLIFKSAPPFPFTTQAELVLACAGLQNFLQKHFRSDAFPEEVITPNNDQANFEEVIHVGALESQEREYANNWRDSIALSMWNDAVETGSQR